MFFTYEPWTKATLQAHEHATIHYRSDGIMLILSRESTRSVGRRWDIVGRWWKGVLKTDSAIVVRFDEDSFATRMVATSLVAQGYSVTGLKLVTGEYGTIIVLESNGRTTNPESIRGRIRNREPGNARDKRHNVQGLYGRLGSADTAAMRKAILERQAARK